MSDKYSIKQLLSLIDAHWPEVSSVENDVIMCLIRMNDLIMNKAKEKLAPLGLTHAAFEVLTTLRALPPPRQLTPTELYKSALLTSGGMTKLLKNLEEHGYIERVWHETDKRSKLVKLTESGEIAAAQAMEAVSIGDRQILGETFSNDEMQKLRKLFLKGLEKLE